MTSTRFVRTCLLFASALATPALLTSTAALAQTAPTPSATPTPTAKPVTTAARPLAPLTGTLEPYRGNIRSFEGDIDPYRGNIRSFWGEINPYEGDLTAFWGNIRSFTEEGEAGVAPVWGNIRSFWGELSPLRGNIRSFWGELDPLRGNIRSFDDYGTLAGMLDDFVDQSATFWRDAVEATTGKTFEDAFANPLLAKYGIDLKNPASLQNIDVDSRERFFIEWYDGLMNFSGADHVDHWMRQISWSPKLTQVQGSGSDAVIGLVDFHVAKDPDVIPKLIYSGGYTNVVNGHGVGVLSLITASHDGKGVMGIAPNAKIAAFNPFDSTGTASWADVTKGIAAVAGKGAAVVNLSLGVPGYTLHPEWRNVFKTSSVDSLKDKTLYVIAAGNDGITQTGNVEMNGALDNTFIVVGSVDPTGKISDFSNRPGTVCLTDGGSCKNTAGWNGTGKFAGNDYLKESGLLMNRFIVAPGEFILVSDGKGGVTRMSGTSFAAPLVAGTVALIHDRWPWLKRYPRDVAKAILESATDLGAPGVDPVYGMGMLNVEAAQSALDFDKMKYYLVDGTRKTEVKASTLQSTGIQSSWVTKNLFFSAFEELDDSYRDFLIPLSNRLVGTTVNGEYFQEFVYNRFVAWMGGTSSLAGGTAPMGKGFSDLRSTPMMGNLNGWKVSMSGRLTDDNLGRGYFRPRLRSAVQVESPSGKFGFSMGQGDGAVYLGGQAAFQTTSDFDSYSGGVNPLLGFASGGAHVASRVALAPNVNVSVGVTERRMGLGDDLRGIVNRNDRSLIRHANRYQSLAANVRVDYKATDWLDLTASMTRLDEEQALLGVRSLEPADLDGGTVTDGVTLSATASFGEGVSLFGSATGARSKSVSDAAQLQIDNRGLVGSAFQVGVSKERLLGKSDNLRLSLTQPLTTEAGSLEMQMVRVVDRQTGEIGVVTERYDISGAAQRRFIAEAVYGTAVLEGRGNLSLFGRTELRGVDANVPRVMLGSRASLTF
jgi:hypothetical protein